MASVEKRYDTVAADLSMLKVFADQKGIAEGDLVRELIGRAESRLAFAKMAMDGGQTGLAHSDLDRAFGHQARAWALARKG